MLKFWQGVLVGVMFFGVILLLIVQCDRSWAQQTPPTKAQIEERLKNVRIEKRYLELQVEEQTLTKALENMEKAKAEKKEEKKVEKAK